MPPALPDPHVDVHAVQRLDPAAVDAVFDAYAPRIFRFLRRLGAGEQVAEELVQETFLRLVRAAPRLAPDTRLGAWLYTVARNLWRSHRRWAWIDGSRLLELATRPTPREPSPSEVGAARDLLARTERAVAELPAAQREVFVLVAAEGLEPAEAAEILGITPEAARQRLARARRAIEEALA